MCLPFFPGKCVCPMGLLNLPPPLSLSLSLSVCVCLVLNFNCSCNCLDAWWYWTFEGLTLYTTDKTIVTIGSCLSIISMRDRSELVRSHINTYCKQSSAIVSTSNEVLVVSNGQARSSLGGLKWCPCSKLAWVNLDWMDYNSALPNLTFFSFLSVL